MAQIDQTTSKTVTGSTLAGLISSFKSSVGLGGSSGGLFASLLAETETSMPQVDSRAPSSHDDAPVPEDLRSSQGQESNNVRDSATRVDVREDSRTAAQNKRDAKEPSTDSSSKACDRTREQEERSGSEEAAPVKDTNKQDETEVTTKALDKNDDVKVNAKDVMQVDDQDLAALLAALLPLADKAVKIAEGSETTGAVKEVKGDAEQLLAVDPDLAALATLQSATDQVVGDISQRKTKTPSLHEDKNNGDGVQKLVAQTAQQGVIAAEGSLDTKEDSDLSSDAQEDMAGVYTEMVAESSSSSRGTNTAGAQNTAQDVYNLLRGSTQNQTGNGAQNVAAPVTQFQNAAQSSTEATTSGVQAAGGAKAAQTTLPMGDGLRPAGSYDFASQLSAARVTKGGAAGLPQAIEQVSVQLNKAAKDGIDQITIQLRPAELGKIEIKLEFAADKTVTGTVIADNQATLNMLQKDSASLQRALQEAGLQADAGCMQFSLRDDNNASRFANQQQNGSGTNNSFSNDNLTDETDLAVNAPDVETYYLSPGRVNLRV